MNAIFEWDEQKRRSNIEKHGLDFIAAAEIFDGRPIVTVQSTSLEEERFLTVGSVYEMYCERSTINDHERGYSSPYSGRTQLNARAR